MFDVVAGAEFKVKGFRLGGKAIDFYQDANGCSSSLDPHKCARDGSNVYVDSTAGNGKSSVPGYSSQSRYIMRVEGGDYRSTMGIEMDIYRDGKLTEYVHYEELPRREVESNSSFNLKVEGEALRPSNWRDIQASYSDLNYIDGSLLKLDISDVSDRNNQYRIDFLLDGLPTVSSIEKPANYLTLDYIEPNTSLYQSESGQVVSNEEIANQLGFTLKADFIAMATSSDYLKLELVAYPGRDGTFETDITSQLLSDIELTVHYVDGEISADIVNLSLAELEPKGHLAKGQFLLDKTKGDISALEITWSNPASIQLSVSGLSYQHAPMDYHPGHVLFNRELNPVTYEYEYERKDYWPKLSRLDDGKHLTLAISGDNYDATVLMHNISVTEPLACFTDPVVSLLKPEDGNYYKLVRNSDNRENLDLIRQSLVSAIGPQVETWLSDQGQYVNERRPVLKVETDNPVIDVVLLDSSRVPVVDSFNTYDGESYVFNGDEELLVNAYQQDAGTISVVVTTLCGSEGETTSTEHTVALTMVDDPAPVLALGSPDITLAQYGSGLVNLTVEDQGRNLLLVAALAEVDSGYSMLGYQTTYVDELECSEKPCMSVGLNRALNGNIYLANEDSYSLQMAIATEIAPGVYPVTIVAFDTTGHLTELTNHTLTVNPRGTPKFPQDGGDGNGEFLRTPTYAIRELLGDRNFSIFSLDESVNDYFDYWIPSSSEPLVLYVAKGTNDWATSSYVFSHAISGSHVCDGKGSAIQNSYRGYHDYGPTYLIVARQGALTYEDLGKIYNHYEAEANPEFIETLNNTDKDPVSYTLRVEEHDYNDQLTCADFD